MRVHIHIHFHASYDVEADSVRYDAVVTSWNFGERYDVQDKRVIHQEAKEIIWEDGKEVSIRCAVQKALARYFEACENVSSPF